MKGIFCIFILCFFVQASAQNQQLKVLEVEADTLLAHENYSGALKLYNRILDTTTPRSEAEYLLLYKRAVCQYSLHHFNEALQDINTFLAKISDYQANLLKAFIGRELNEANIQVEALNALLMIDSGNVELLRWRASALLESGKYSEARKDIKILNYRSPDPELDLFTGISFYYEDKPDSAITYFDRVIALDKKSVTAYMYAGSVCLDQSAYDLALQYLNTGIKLDPENLSMIFYKGIALTEQGKIDQGCRCLLKAFNGGVDEAGDYLKEYCFGVDE